MGAKIIMEQQLRVSIIIPFFNAAGYLRRCLDSVMNQDLDMYEVVCVNDGSTDASLAVAEEYLPAHSGMRIISQPNGGLSNARNNGMRIAAGEYLMFVDADDYLEERVLGRLYDLCKSNRLDMLDYRVNVIRDGRVGLMYPDPGWVSEVADGRSYLERYIATYGKQPFVSAWSHLYRRQMITGSGLTFIEGRKYEDLVFTAGAYLASERVMYTDTVVYNYVKVHDSITTSGVSRAHIEDLHFMAREVSRLAETNGIRIPMDNFFTGIRNHMISVITSGRWKEYKMYFDRDIFRKTGFCLFRPRNRFFLAIARMSYTMFVLYSRAVATVKRLRKPGI